MPVTITRLTKEQAAKEFTRPSNSVENLTDYIETLRPLEIGEGFTIRVAEAMGKDKDGNDKLQEVVPDSGEGDNVDTVRAFKRRMNSAADNLNIGLKWKPKGHRTGEGDNVRFVTDWLAVKVTETKPVKIKADKNGTGK